MGKNVTKTIQLQKSIEDSWSVVFSRNIRSDFPVSILYVEPSKMYSGSQRLHWHAEFEINFVRTGTAVFNIGDSTVTVPSGNAIIIGGGRIHSVEDVSDGKCSIISVMFSPDFIFGSENKEVSMLTNKYYLPLTDNSFKYQIFENKTDSGSSSIDIIQELLKVNLDKKYGFELLTKSLLCRLWLQVMELHIANNEPEKNSINSFYDEQRVKIAISYISENYTRALTLEEIADSVPVSKSECCRCFKRVTRETPFEYIMIERVFQVALLLQRPDSFDGSMQLLATQNGFNNASYFNKTFKKYTGETPSQFKESVRKKHRDALSPFGIPM